MKSIEISQVKTTPTDYFILTVPSMVMSTCSYAGRVELPDNLKSLFRPVAMMVPDTGMITEVLLFTHCFTTATKLALKLTRFFEAINAQISAQVCVCVRVACVHVCSQMYLLLVFIYFVCCCYCCCCCCCFHVQHHYDFGLRSVKAVINLAGDYLKKRYMYDLLLGIARVNIIKFCCFVAIVCWTGFFPFLTCIFNS